MTKPLTVNEAAEHTGLPVSTLNRWRCEGRGPAFGKLGRRVFYRPEVLDAWMEAQFAASADSATSVA